LSRAVGGHHAGGVHEQVFGTRDFVKVQREGEDCNTNEKGEGEKESLRETIEDEAGRVGLGKW
jgi:hypothetical protein